MAPKEILTLKILNSNSRKIIWTCVGLVTTIVGMAFTFGGQYTEISSKLNQIPVIAKTVAEHDAAIKDMQYIRKDVKEVKGDIKTLIQMHMKP